MYEEYHQTMVKLYASDPTLNANFFGSVFAEEWVSKATEEDLVFRE